MDIDGDRDPDPEGTIEEDVPVYEPLYPELEAQCSHQKCDNESEPRARLCEHCWSIMADNDLMECPFCGQARVSGRYKRTLNEDDDESEE